MPSLIGLLRLFKLPFIWLSTPPPGTFKGQTILVTGANAGVGLEAVKHFARLGASRIVLGVRSFEKGQPVKDVITSDTSLTTEIDVWEVDLDSFASVKAFAAKCDQLPRLDVAIMNAGMVTGKYELSADGWEKTLQVNVLCTALLSCLLMPLLVRSRKVNPGSTPHLSIVSSDAHLQAIFPEQKDDKILESLNTEASLKKDVFDRYAVSKLIDGYIAIELANLAPKIGEKPVVIVNYVTPGFCKSGLLKQTGEPPLVLRIVEVLLARDVRAGLVVLR